MYKREYKINDSTLTIRLGNIIESNADVIVSSDDNYLTQGGGVSKAICTAAGSAIRDEVKKYIPAQLGDAVVTTAGKMKQKYIFHCVTIDFDDRTYSIRNEDVQRYVIRRSMDKCLRLMPLLGVKSIAFPAIGAGAARYTLEEVAKHMLECIVEFLCSTNKKYSIELYLFNRFQEVGVEHYIPIFESAAKCIGYHYASREFNLNIQKSETEESFPTLALSDIGKMAVASPNDPHDIFFSYSRKDLDAARIFCKILDELDAKYWIDVNGQYSSDNFKEVIVDAISNSQIVLFLSSTKSNASKFVIKEMSLACKYNKRILPIKLDDAPFAKSISFDLCDIDWIDYSKVDKDDAIYKFRQCIQLYLIKHSQIN